jgi:nucleoside-diphosphate-sugar epimerase
MILVTGGTGMLGSYLLHELIASGKQVKALRRKGSSAEITLRVFSLLAGNKAEALMDQIEWTEGDVLDYYSLEDTLQGVEEVYHCAAVVSFDPADKKRMMKINIEGTANMVNAALSKGIRKLCHVSSIASLSRSEKDEIITEDSYWKSSKRNSAYSVSKYGGEREVWRGIEEGLEAVIVNPALIIGYAGTNRGSAQMFSTIDKCSWFYSNGVNGFVDVRDVARAMIQLMGSDIRNQRFVVVADSLSYREIFTMMAQNLGKKLPFIKAGSVLLEGVWRFEKVRSILFHSHPMITRETVNTQKNQYYYSAKKLEDAIGFRFTPMTESIAFHAKAYRGISG